MFILVVEGFSMFVLMIGIFPPVYRLYTFRVLANSRQGEALRACFGCGLHAVTFSVKVSNSCLWHLIWDVVFF